MTNLTGAEIVKFSQIGKIADDVQFVDGRTMADYKAMLATLADQMIAVIPAAVAEVGKAQTKEQLDELYRINAKRTWGKTDYWTINGKGDKAITEIARWQMDDLVRMLRNMVDQA